MIGDESNKALLRKIYSLALPNFRRARRYTTKRLLDPRGLE